MSWNNVLEDRFGMQLSPEKAERWKAELQRDIIGLSGEELTEAIREASTKDRSKYDGKPTVTDIRIWVLSRRKKLRRNIAFGPSDEECSLCTNGWLTYIPEDGPYANSSGVGVPCPCSMGQKRLESAYALEVQSSIRDMGMEAKDYTVARNRETDEWTRRWVEAGKPGVEEMVDIVASKTGASRQRR